MRSIFPSSANHFNASFLSASVRDDESTASESAFAWIAFFSSSVRVLKSNSLRTFSISASCFFASASKTSFFSASFFCSRAISSGDFSLSGFLGGFFTLIAHSGNSFPGSKLYTTFGAHSIPDFIS